MFKLTGLQQSAIRLVKEGHNTLVLGQAGTGKTFLLRRFADELISSGKSIGVLSTTGVSASALQDYGGTTLHKWSGIGDGRFSAEYLAHLISTDEAYRSAKQNIQSADAVIIDEISMLSQLTLESFESICRVVRSSDLRFGGIQVIMAGDFYQLPPVASPEYGDNGHYCFSSPVFSSFPHKVLLDRVLRQQDATLITCINELASGQHLSEASSSLLTEVSRPLQQQSTRTTVLFSRNFETDIFNAEKLNQLEGKHTTYTAKDSGDLRSLTRSKIPKYVALKVGAPVVLTANLSDRLFNGIMGEVHAITSAGPLVKFFVKGSEEVVNITPHTFTIYSPSQQKVTATRKQLPLRLAFALTIHKCQGMTLPSVEVHCQHIFAAGQLGVAVGRVTSRAGLRVVGFSPHLLTPHPSEVNEFYEQLTNSDAQADLSCCKTPHAVPSDVLAPTADDSGSSFSESEMLQIDEMLATIPDVIVQQAAEEETVMESGCLAESIREILPDQCPLSVDDLLAELRPRDPVYPIDLQWIAIGDALLHSGKERMQNYINQTWIGICNSFAQHLSQLQPEAPIKCKDLTTFHASRHTFFGSDAYRQSYASLMECTLAQQDAGRMLFSYTAAEIIGRVVLETATSHAVKKQQAELDILPLDELQLSAEGMGKIRYVAGRCVAKLTSKHRNSWRRLMYAEGSHQKMICKSTVETLNYLDCLTASYADLHKTSEMPETLEETARKQNIRQSLYNISDNAFRFFLLLEKHRVHLETKGRFEVEQQDVISVVEAQLLDTAELKEAWRALFLSTDVTESASLDTLFRKMVHSFVLVASNYFRKDLIRSYGQKKTESHRRQIQMRHQKEKDLTAKLSSATIAADTSERKQLTHLQLQSILRSNPNFFSARTYSKEELKTFFSAYTLPWRTRRLKTQLAADLCARILAVDSMSEPNAFGASSPISSTADVLPATCDEPQPGPSGLQHHTMTPTIEPQPTTRKRASAAGKGKGKGKRSRSERQIAQEPAYICPTCSKDVGNSPCVGCDICGAWLHRECAGLLDDKNWAEVSASDEPWTCPKCFNMQQ